MNYRCAYENCLTMMPYTKYLLGKANERLRNIMNRVPGAFTTTVSSKLKNKKKKSGSKKSTKNPMSKFKIV